MHGDVTMDDSDLKYPLGAYYFPSLIGDDWNETTDNSNVNESARGEVELRWSALGLAVIIFATAFGNLLLCLAVMTERRLQNMTNYFLTSLAVADLLVALLVMPLGMIIELFGYFPLGPSVCIVWATADVLCCTASIWHMATMSVDRYVSIRFPLRYNGQARTRASVVWRISFVWILSLLICGALPVSGIVDYSNVYSEADRQCVPVIRYFVVYGSVVAFYVPLVIMIVTYVLTVVQLRRNELVMSRIRAPSHSEVMTGSVDQPVVTVTAAPAAVTVTSSDNVRKKDDSSEPYGRLRVQPPIEEPGSADGSVRSLRSVRDRSVSASTETPRVEKVSSTSAGHRQVRVESLAVIGRAIGLQSKRSSPIPFSDCCSRQMANSDEGVRDPDDEDSETDKLSSEKSLSLSRDARFDYSKADDCPTTRRVDAEFSSTTPSPFDNGVRGSSDPSRLSESSKYRDHGDEELENPLLSDEWPTLSRGKETSTLIICDDRKCDENGVVGSNRSSCFLPTSAAVIPQEEKSDSDLPVRHSVAPSSSIFRRNNQDLTVPSESTATIVDGHLAPPLPSTLNLTASTRTIPKAHRRCSVTSTSRARRQSGRQTRATRVLGVMFSVFVLMWSPFFIANLIRLSCSEVDYGDGVVQSTNSSFSSSSSPPPSVDSVGANGGCANRGPGDAAMSWIVWLGYTSSLANPVIYTAISAPFRAAFRNILSCKMYPTRATQNRHRLQNQRRTVAATSTVRPASMFSTEKHNRETVDMS